ncbi:MAG: CehA/McbA family metallohydrolase [Gammaproteobacteria bacterium]
MKSFSLGVVGAFVFAAFAMGQGASAQAKLHWYRGNTHTHTINSDGDAAPDAVVRWYREHGYQFIVITDHEFLTDVAPLQGLFGADEQFLVMPGQEVTQIVADARHPEGKRQAHLNAINSARVVMPMGEPQPKNPRIGRVAPAGTPIAETYARNLAAITAAGGIGQINHPNWRWSVGLEDMAQLPNGTLFELWNGIREINNLGGTDDAGNVALSTEALWDTLLSRGKVLWGVGSDDTHDLYKTLSDPEAAPPGQAWIVVRAEKLSPAAIVGALQRGDFYASTGVALEDYEAGPAKKEIVITLKHSGSDRDDTRFLTRFVGKGGRVLAEVPGLKPRYLIKGDEGYVRAAIVDSNGRRAWTQPVILK